MKPSLWPHSQVMLDYWRGRAEVEIHGSGLDYTNIRARVLTNGPPGKRPLEIGQQDWPLTFPTRIARADVAEIFVTTLKGDQTRKATFEVFWGTGPNNLIWRESFARLRPDEKAA